MSSKRLPQKAKRSTSKPRAGTKRTAQPKTQVAPLGAPVVGSPAFFDAIRGLSAEPPREPQRDRAHRWSITYATREQLFRDEPSERQPPSLEEFHPAALQQFEEARQLAMKALDSGVVGEAECVTIISGQGNADHKPTNGQPNDGLSIVIRQVGS